MLYMCVRCTLRPPNLPGYIHTRDSYRGKVAKSAPGWKMNAAKAYNLNKQGKSNQEFVQSLKTAPANVMISGRLASYNKIEKLEKLKLTR